MKFDVETPTCREGVFVPVNFAGPHEIARTIQRAEELGYHTVWGTDFVVTTPSKAIPDKQPPNWYEIMISLAYAAAGTKKIKLATGTVQLLYRDPVILAKQTATLDQLSGGRFILGLGLGPRDEFEAIKPGEKGSHRGRMFDEKLEALQLLLRHNKGEVSYKGKYVEFNSVNLDPKPIQNPLPVYVPGRTSEALRRVARLGLGCMIRSWDAQERLSALRPMLEEFGREPQQVDVVGEAQLSLDKTHSGAVERYKNSRLGYYNRKQDLSKLVDTNWIGTPEEVAQKMAVAKRAGISHFLVLHIAGDTLQEHMEQMQWFAEEVMPLIKSA